MINSIKILGIEYSIDYVDCVDRHEPKEGQINYYDQSIQIANWLSPERQQTVLIHEVLHGIAEGLNLNDKLDEDTVSMLARAIHSVLVDSNLNLQVGSSEHLCSEPNRIGDLIVSVQVDKESLAKEIVKRIEL